MSLRLKVLFLHVVHFYFLFSFYLYVKYSKNNKKNYFFGSLILFLLALLSSEEAITLPLIIILYEFVFNRDNFNKKSIKNKIIKNFAPYFVFAALFAALRLFILGITGRQEQYLAGSFLLTQLTMLKAYVYYIYLLIFPVNLSLYHDIIPVVSVFDPKAFLSAFLLLTIFFFTVKYYRKRVLFFSVFWFFITLIPFSNLLPLQIFMAERYLYVPSIGFSLIFSY